MTVSVAICTYNGAEYIGSQLRSILEQTVPVGEVVVCDDGSSDGTLAIVESIANQTDIPIRVFENKPNLGVCANFDKAIKLCKGDIIFLSDQDDIWMPEKVETVQQWFEGHPGKEVVFSDAEFIDSAGGIYMEGLTLFRAVGMTSRAIKWFDCGYALELFLKNNRATGATMAIRAEIASQFRMKGDKSVKDNPLHDYLLALMAIKRDTLGYINKPLIHYRIHENQTCGLNSCLLKPEDSDSLFSPVYWYYNLGSVILKGEDVSSQVKCRIRLSERRHTRKARPLRYFMSCVKDFRLYLLAYRSLGLLLFISDAFHLYSYEKV